MRRSLLLGFTALGEVVILAGPNPQAAKDAGRALFSARESKFAEIQLWTSGRGVSRRRRFSPSASVVEEPPKETESAALESLLDASEVERDIAVAKAAHLQALLDDQTAELDRYKDALENVTAERNEALDQINAQLATQNSPTPPAAETAAAETPGGTSAAAGGAGAAPSTTTTPNAPAASGSTQSEPAPSAPAAKKKGAAPEVKF